MPCFLEGVVEPIALWTNPSGAGHNLSQWVMIWTNVHRCAGRVQFVCSQSPGVVQQHIKKSDVSVEVSFPVSKKTQTLPLVCTNWWDGLGV